MHELLIGLPMDDHWMSEGIMVPRIPSDGGMRELSLAKLLEALSERTDVTLAPLSLC
jgi:hypothetical protein